MSPAALLAGNRDIEGTTGLRLADYVEEIVASGFPAIRALPPRVRRAEPDAYLENVVHYRRRDDVAVIPLALVGP